MRNYVSIDIILVYYIYIGAKFYGMVARTLFFYRNLTRAMQNKQSDPNTFVVYYSNRLSPPERSLER